MRRDAFIVVLISALLSIVGVSEAHKLSIYAYVEGSRVHSEGYYFDGTECKGCVVKVIDPFTNRELLSGRTNDEGIYEFGKPGSLPVRIELTGEDGHIASFVLEELRPDNTYSRRGGEEGVAAMMDDSVKLPETQPGAAMGDLDIEAAIEAKVKPLREEVERLRRKTERPGITEILGGIGYIAGLAGLWLYTQSRKKRH